MSVPAEIAGIGSTQLRLRPAPGFDPRNATGIGPEEYFVLSRIDGTQTIKEVLLATGLPVDRAIAVIVRLRSAGALLLPGETVPPKPTPPPAPPAPPSTGPSRPGTAGGASAGASPAKPGHDLSLARPSADEIAALAEVCDLTDSERRLVLTIMRLVPRNDPWAVLGVPQNADKRALKHAYFALSKEIHPDRYYGKRLGSFAPRMAIAFEVATRAYERLISGRQRATSPSAAPEPQSPQVYAAELFDRACQLEVNGDPLEAMKLFAAAVRVDPQLRYLRRAATCALAAGQPRTAIEYAKKVHGMAPQDPSSARLLASAFRAIGRLAEAEEVLVMAMALKSENDTLTAELRNDLAELRRQIASSESR